MSTTTLALLTLDVDGEHVDLAVPSGARLGEVLLRRGIDTARIPYRLDGKRLYPDQRIGSDIPTGSMVVLHPEFYEPDEEFSDVVPPNKTATGQWAGHTGIATTLLGIMLTVAGVYFAASETVQLPVWQALALGAGAFAVGVLLALQDTWNRPLLETLAPLSFGTAAGALSVLGNDGEITYQIIITASIAAATLAVVRWAWRGRTDEPTAQVSADAAGIGFVLGLAGLIAVFSNVHINLFAAIIFGLSAPLMIASPAFTIRVKDSALIDESAVTREARAVRRSTPVEPEPVRSSTAGHVTAASAARQELWTILLSLGLTLPTPIFFAAATSSSWIGRAAIGALLCSVFILLLTPRTARRAFIRLVPRLAAVLLLAIGLSFARGIGTAVILFGLAGLTLTLPYLILHKRKPLILTRLADIFQSLAGTLALPLALGAVGVVELVRTGGIV